MGNSTKVRYFEVVTYHLRITIVTLKNTSEFTDSIITWTMLLLLSKK